MNEILSNGLPRQMSCYKTRLRRKEDGKMFTVTGLGSASGIGRTMRRTSGHEFTAEDGEIVKIFMDSVTDERKEVARLFEDPSLAEFDPKLWAGTGI